MPPALVISLDFELLWGVRDVWPRDGYRQNLLGVRQAIPALLELFRARGIRATWATVGFLFCRTRAELEATLPARLPSYVDATLSPYDFSDVGRDEASDPLHFAPSLVEQIARTVGQEVATHTFSHFYCLEEGQTEAEFDADLESARRAAARLDIELKSLIFPRNQENPRYLPTLRRNGIRAFRPTARGWAYRSGVSKEPRVKRLLRLADAYVSLSGSRSFRQPHADASGLVAVPASAFLRPYSPRLRHGDPLLLRRIAGCMTAAAERGELFHLWWHPHNFGSDLRENIDRLSRLLDHFADLSKKHGMESMSMIDVAERG